MRNDKWKMIFYYLTTDKSLAASDVAGAELSGRGRGRTRKGHVLHAQVREQSLEHLHFLRLEIALSLGVQHSQNIDPVFRSFQVNPGLARNGMRHHA